MHKVFSMTITLLLTLGSMAVLVAVASAETTLLAVWLLNGSEIVSNISTTQTGEFILEDTKVGIGIECSVSLVGTVGSNGTSTVTGVLSLAGAEVTLTAPLSCESHKFCEEGTADIELSPEGLPYPSLIFLMSNGEILRLTFIWKWFSACLVLGLKVSEECGWEDVEYQVKNVTGGVETTGTGTPGGQCTTGGAGAGVLTFVAGNLMTPTAGGTLSVASEEGP